ncbi:MAG: (d)CMP kinase [Clostridia bacterium]|nr:(d)CMP kinase [Clostridia bacterium]
MLKIAIDGPSGAGKSSLARAVAKKMGIVYVDTGAMYRTVGLYVAKKGVDPKDAEAVTALLPEISLEIKFENGEQHIYLCGEDVGDSIRTPEMSMYASAVSAIGAVRAFLLDTQRNLAKSNSVIMDGRDIGTVIFPDADVKIFLTASAEARAERRYKELCQKGIETTLEDVLADMRLRDKNDSEREIAPAVAADDAVIFDNSELSFDESISRCIEIIEDTLSKKGKTKKKKKKRSFYMFMHFLVARMFRFTMRIKAHGLENLPLEGGAVICPNHLSMWDVITVGAVTPRQIHFMAKAELFKIPVLSFFLRAMGAKGVDRKSSGTDAIKYLIGEASKGDLVGIFPQGTRRTGENPADTPLKNGAALVAYRAKVAMVPVCIVTKKMKYRFLRRKDIYIGKPIPYSELGFVNGGSEEYAAATEKVFAEVCRLGGFEKTKAASEE